METTQIISLLLGPFRAIIFYFAIMNTFILVRNLLHMHAALNNDKSINFSAWLIRIPTIYWTVLATTYFINFT